MNKLLIVLSLVFAWSLLSAPHAQAAQATPLGKNVCHRHHHHHHRHHHRHHHFHRH